MKYVFELLTGYLSVVFLYSRDFPGQWAFVFNAYPVVVIVNYRQNSLKCILELSTGYL